MQALFQDQYWNLQFWRAFQDQEDLPYSTVLLPCTYDVV